MKRRYSPAARKAHLRAMHLKPVVQEVEQTNPIRKLIESYQQGFLTALELADLILETLPLPKPEPAPKPFLCVRCKQPCSPDYSLCQDCFDKDNGAPTPRPEPKPEIEQRRDAELERVWREGLLTTPRYQEELRKIERDPRLGICQACGQLCVPGFLFHSECFNGYTPDPLLQPPAPKPPKVGGYYSEYENGTWIQQAESAEDWAAGLTMPSPPWEGGAA